MEFRDVIKGIDLFPQVNFVNLEKIELFRRQRVENEESLMNDNEYHLYLENKYGIGSWAENLIIELVELRIFRKKIKSQLIKLPIVIRYSRIDRLSLARWEEEGGRVVGLL